MYTPLFVERPDLPNDHFVSQFFDTHKPITSPTTLTRSMTTLFRKNTSRVRRSRNPKPYLTCQTSKTCTKWNTNHPITFLLTRNRIHIKENSYINIIMLQRTNPLSILKTIRTKLQILTSCLLIKLAQNHSPPILTLPITFCIYQFGTQTHNHSTLTSCSHHPNFSLKTPNN